MAVVDLTRPLQLSSGAAIPRLGLGVFRSGAGAGTRDAVLWALEAGYRHIDTAAVYRNEAEVGEALRHSGIPRQEVFLTTKLWRDDYGYDQTLRAFDASIARLGVDTLDLYLMHWPSPDTRVETWRALAAIRQSGRCRAIGVSNFTAHHLRQLIDATGVTPEVNQVELHPFLQQTHLVSECNAHGIAVEAWAPLTKGQRLDHPALLSIAAQTQHTVAQVLIRWSLQKGFVVIPKSSDAARIRENASVFDWTLSSEQMERLDALEEGYRTAPGWDPSATP
jgi:diketogulonate reductase-like aldo/keto reductase